MKVAFIPTFSCSAVPGDVRSPKDLNLIVPCLTRREFVENFLKLNRSDTLCSELVSHHAVSYS